ncbi:MAG: hypothetical protein WBM81_17970 [Sedimenticolaceae bacterium]
MQMRFSTVVPSASGAFPAQESAADLVDYAETFEPVESTSASTHAPKSDCADAAPSTGERIFPAHFEPPVARRPPIVDIDSTPLQIWEGTVVEVDDLAQMMRVVLEAKMGQAVRHTGEINLEWVSEQDRELVEPGAVFYLTLFKRTRRGSVQNSQELRFRRRPSWSSVQLQRVRADAEMIRSKMKSPPSAI